jgi:hypothetical protein
MMLRPAVLGLSLSIAVSASSTNYEPPDSILPLQAVPGKTPLRVEPVTVSAFLFGSSGSLAELNTAECQMVRGRQSVRFTTPMTIGVPLYEGAAQKMTVTCSAILGPRTRKTAVEIEPLVPEVSAKPSSARTYPASVSVRFLQ